MKEGVTVIICCFNSSQRLKPTLEHLYQQKKIEIAKWEIILVDNSSTDNTVKVAEEIWAHFTSTKPPFKIVSEQKAGLSSARNKGIAEAEFKFVLFCDDDNWLDNNYVFNALAIIKSSPTIGALGGKGSPVFEAEEPPYFWKNQYHVLAVGRQSDIEGDITNERGVVYGAGMILNKSAYYSLINMYNFSFQVSDRIGNNLMSSGDHELCLALKLAGYKIYYSESLLFKHYIPKKRTSIDYYKKLFISFGKSHAMLAPYFYNKRSMQSVSNNYIYISVRCIKNIVLIFCKLLISGYYISSNKYSYIDDLHGLYNNIGILMGMISLKNRYKRIIKERKLFNLDK